MAKKLDFGQSRTWVSILLILLGVLLILHNLDILYLGDLFSFWPLLLIGIGILKLVNSKFQDVAGAGVLMLIGVIFLLLEFDVVYWDEIWRLWPLFLIAVGVYLIYKNAKASDAAISGQLVRDNRIDTIAIFGGRKQIVTSDAFEGGNVTVMFGGTEIDFGDAGLAPGENVLDIFTVFGGTEIFVPDYWHVDVKGLALFGGFSDERSHIPSLESETNRVLTLKGLALFGGVGVKNASSRKMA